MGRAALVAAWACSLLPTLDPACDLGQASTLGWALVPWIALAGLPNWGPAGSRTAPLAIAALALPPLALGGALDRAAGLPWADLAFTAALGLALVYLLARAAERGRVRPGVHGAIWALLVPGSVLCAWSLGQAGVELSWLARVAGASPLAWALGEAAGPRGLGAGLGSVSGALGAFAVTGLCLLASARRPA